MYRFLLLKTPSGIWTMFKKYNAVSEKIKALQVPIQKKLLSISFAAVLSLLIVSGPICILINLMIFKDMQELLAFGIATMLIVFVLLINYFYLKCITDGKVEDLRIVYFTDTLISAFVIYGFLIVIYILGVL